MIRSDILKDIAPILRDQLVVCNIGLPSQELHMIDDQPTNFYMLGTMGLSSSIGLGVALAQDKTTYAGQKTSLTAVAKACGCENVIECQAEDTGKTLQAAIDSKKMTIIVAKCESGNIKVPVITKDPVVIRDRFMTAVKA